MIEFVAYLSSQQQTEDLARQALPDAPIRPAPAIVRRDAPRGVLRQRISLALRRLADRIEPAPAGADPVVASC